MKTDTFINELEPEHEKIPNIVLQIRKSIDTGGSRPLTFRNGDTKLVSVNDMLAFMDKYSSIKPVDREVMQAQALDSFDSFMDVLVNFGAQAAPKSIY